ncbi:MAG: hypothetical protein M9920_10495 [Verrucomicrobiae bacterium]|nr:hypothetical protein [Verrucomicrobiae bacterium]
MKSLPPHYDDQATGARFLRASVLTTETTTLSSDESERHHEALPLEKTLQHQAAAMSDLLAEILERPMTPRFWGINE